MCPQPHKPHPESGGGRGEEDSVRPHRQRIQRRNLFGVYGIFTSLEIGSTFTSKPTEDPDSRIIRRVPSRYLHYYFYIRDPVIGLPDDLLSEWPQLHRDRTPPPRGSVSQGRQRLPADLGPQGITRTD